MSFSWLGLAVHAIAQDCARTGKALGLDKVDSFLAIDANGLVTVYSGKVDLGTGVLTALTQIAADELDVPLTSVTVVQGDTALTPDQGTTWGSLTIHRWRPNQECRSGRARRASRPCVGETGCAARGLVGRRRHDQRRRQEREFWRPRRRKIFLPGGRS